MVKGIFTVLNVFTLSCTDTTVNRRAVFAALGIGLCLVLAGCTAPLGGNQPNELTCSLNHEIIDDGDRFDSIDRRYEYATLSPPAKDAFDSSLAANGTAYRAENGSITTPREFEYTDTLTHYEIDRDAEAYTLATWSAEGCTV